MVNFPVVTSYQELIIVAGGGLLVGNQNNCELNHRGELLHKEMYCTAHFAKE